jgi:hypothetical protein
LGISERSKARLEETNPGVDIGEYNSKERRVNFPPSIIVYTIIQAKRLSQYRFNPTNDIRV